MWRAQDKPYQTSESCQGINLHLNPLKNNEISLRLRKHLSILWEGFVCHCFCILNHWHLVFQEPEMVGEVLIDVVRRGSSIVSLSDEPGGTIG